MNFRDDVYLGTKCPMMPPLMNGGGCCKTIEDVKEISRSLAGAVLVGSITVEERTGNSGDVFWVGDGAALNSLGMPNGGARYFQDNFREIEKSIHGAGKLFVVNVAGFSSSEYGQLAEVALMWGADAVELNLGCPNVIKSDGSRKPIASFNLEAMEEIFSKVQVNAGKANAIWVKVSPYSDPELLKSAAALILRYPMVKSVTAINTFPCAFGLNEKGKSAITPGLAGLSGKALKYIGLGQAKQWLDALERKIPLIAAGGITSGQDVRDYELVGASAFQMTTELLKKGYLNAYPFENVADEYNELT
jgi:dihydroorotate dehydrogenase